MKELRFHGNCIVTGRGSLDYLENIKDKRVFIVTGESSVFANGVYQRTVWQLCGTLDRIR